MRAGIPRQSVFRREDLPFRRNYVLQVAILLYAVLWAYLAFDPYSRFNWMLENLLIFLTLIGLVGTYRIFRFNNLSYLMIFAFLSLHTVGAHFSYNATPFDELLRGWFGFSRNHYDRVVHFSFGLLMVYPVNEFVMRVIRVRNAWSYVLSTVFILACGAFYELIEMWVALIVAPEIGTLFLGTQGDPWDTQHDMELALYGAALTMAATACANRLRRRPTQF